jgi:hypothetical protein
MSIKLKDEKNNLKIAKRVYELSLLGLGDRELAIAFGKDVTTIDYWKKMRPGFRVAISQGKQEADGKVAKSLYKKATGYTQPDEQIFLYKGEVIKAATIKYYPPDTAAAIFWLKNRSRHLPNPWSDVTKHEITGKDGMPLSKTNQLDLADFTEEELAMMARMSIKLKGKEEDTSKARNYKNGKVPK